MAIEVQEINELIDDSGLKLAIYGMAGSGKTTLSTTTGGSTIIISMEGGLLSIKNPPKNVKGIKLENADQLDELHDFFEGEKICDWLILDSGSEIAEMIFEDEKEKTDDPRKLYPAFQSRVISEFKRFRDLQDYNVMITFKMLKIVNQETGLVTYQIDMPGNKLGPQIPYLFDLVFAIRAEDIEDGEPGEQYRILQTKKDDVYTDVKARLPKGITLEMFEEPNLAKIYKKVHAE